MTDLRPNSSIRPNRPVPGSRSGRLPGLLAAMGGLALGLSVVAQPAGAAPAREKREPPAGVPDAEKSPDDARTGTISRSRQVPERAPARPQSPEQKPAEKPAPATLPTEPSAERPAESAGQLEAAEPLAPAEPQAAHPDSDPAAIEVLEAAQQAWANLSSLSADVRVIVEESQIITAADLPAGSGGLRFLRTDRGWAARATGTTAQSGDDERAPADVSLLPLPDSTRWLLAWNKGEQVRTRSTDTPARTLVQHGDVADHRLLMPADLLGPAPLFADALGSFIFTLGKEATVGDEACSVIIKRDADRPDSGQQTEYFIAKSDKLVRRVVERVDSGVGIVIAIGLELGNLKPDAPLTQDDLLLPGEELKDPTPPAGRRPPPVINDGQGSARPNPAQPAKPTRPDGPPAPDFTLALDDGTTVTAADLNGSPVVLYFFGSWSLASRPVSGLVANLAVDAPVEGLQVIAAAVRERPENNVRSALGDPVLPLAIKADAAAAAFKIRLYPTVVVIDQRGRVVGKFEPKPEETPAKLIEDVTQLLEKLRPEDPATQV